MQYMFNMNNYERSVVLAERDHENHASSVDIQEDYQRITITIYPCFFGSHNSRADQRMYLLHEFVHTITHDLHECTELLFDGKLVTREQRRVASEKAVSRTTNILDSLLRGKMRYARDAYSKYLKVRKR